jgi:hypothetical protein
MVHSKLTKGRHRKRGASRGAALMTALVLTAIASIMIAGTATVIFTEMGEEQQEEGYIRSLPIAESAANYVLNEMAQWPAGTTFPMTWSTPGAGGTGQLFTSSYCGPSTLAGGYNSACQVNGVAFVQLTASGTPPWLGGTVGQWYPGETVNLYASGTDQITYNKFGALPYGERQITLTASPVFLAQRYVLFGGTSGNTGTGLNLPSSATTGPLLPSGGYIGTNSGLTGAIYTGSLPAGVRLDGSNAVPPAAPALGGTWSTYDVLAKPYPEYWPTTNQIPANIAAQVKLLIQNGKFTSSSSAWTTVNTSTPGALAALQPTPPVTPPTTGQTQDLWQMAYITNSGLLMPVYASPQNPGPFGATSGAVSPVSIISQYFTSTNTTNANTGFGVLGGLANYQKPLGSDVYRTLILQAFPPGGSGNTTSTGNTFYFSSLNMQPQDTLVLWYPTNGSSTTPPAIRIFLDGSSANTGSFTITNIAINRADITGAPYVFYFMSGTGQSMVTFSPSPNASATSQQDALVYQQTPGNPGAITVAAADGAKLTDAEGNYINTAPSGGGQPLNPVASGNSVNVPGLIYSGNPGSQVVINPAPSPYGTTINSVVGDTVTVNAGNPGQVSFVPAVVEQAPEDAPFTLPPFYRVAVPGGGGAAWEVKPGINQDRNEWNQGIEFDEGDFGG